MEGAGGRGRRIEHGAERGRCESAPLLAQGDLPSSVTGLLVYTLFPCMVCDQTSNGIIVCELLLSELISIEGMENNA